MSFTPDELKKYITNTLNENSLVPAGHKGAFVAYIDESGLRTAIAFKAHDGWQLAGTIGYHPHEDGLDFGFNILKTW